MTDVKPAALDARSLPEISRSSYPEQFRPVVAGRSWRRLGEAFGLTNFGVNLVRLAPEAWSAQRHWHTRQDEFVYVLEGTPTLVTDAGEQVLAPGMVVGFPAGRADGHCLINRTPRDVVFLVVGDRTPGDEADYPDIDLQLKQVAGGTAFVHKDGRPY